MMSDWVEVLHPEKIRICLPIEDETRYGRTVGGLRTANIQMVFEKFLGYKAEIKHTQANDVDVKIFDDAGLFSVLEVSNWREELFYNPDVRYNSKLNDIMRNLTRYDCARYLIVSFQNNIREIEETLTEYNITPIVFGFQTQTPEWKIHFTEQCNKKKYTLWEIRENSPELLLTIQEKMGVHFPKKL